MLVAEPGLRRTAIARSLHGLARRRGPTILFDPTGAEVDHEGLLFGSEPMPGRVRRPGAVEAADATLVVLGAARLAPAAQLALADRLARDGDGARLVLVVEPRDLEGGEALRPELAARLAAGRIDVPALRDRPEDIPDHVRVFLEAMGRSLQTGPLEMSPDGSRALIAHDWPENTRELRRVIEEAALAAAGGEIGSAEIRAAIRSQGRMAAPDRPMDERAWILDGLRRNRFRRGETARFLGISRKTLYNKMRRHGLLE